MTGIQSYWIGKEKRGRGRCSLRKEYVRGGGGGGGGEGSALVSLQCFPGP